MSDFVPCVLRQLPDHLALAAARTAVEINPANAPAATHALYAVALQCAAPAPEIMHHAKIALLTTKYWGAKGVDLGVHFLDTSDAALKAKILTFMNHWGQYGNVRFRESGNGNAQVRIARREGDGYWSYLGTDVLHIPAGEPTMNLESFSLSTPDSEYFRVVEHETGHTLGFPHEHMRKEIVNLLDRQKTIAYFGQTQGWSPAEVEAQVLTPLDDVQLTELPADVQSIMCYQLPASITTNGQPIPGGLRIDDEDGQFAAKIYPKAVEPPGPPGPPAPYQHILFLDFKKPVPPGGRVTFAVPRVPVPVTVPAGRCELIAPASGKGDAEWAGEDNGDG